MKTIVEFMKRNILIAHLIQLISMLSDLLIILICGYVLLNNVYLGVFAIIISYFGVKSTGGLFFSWKKSNIKQFYENWIKLFNN